MPSPRRSRQRERNRPGDRAVYHRSAMLIQQLDIPRRARARASTSAAPPPRATSPSRRSRPGSGGSRASSASRSSAQPALRGLHQRGRARARVGAAILADCERARSDELGSMRTGSTGRLRLGAIPTSLPAVSLLTAPLRASHPGDRGVDHVAQLARRSSAGWHEFELSRASRTSTPSRCAACARSPCTSEHYILLTDERRAVRRA